MTDLINIKSYIRFAKIKLALDLIRAIVWRESHRGALRLAALRFCSSFVVVLISIPLQ